MVAVPLIKKPILRLSGAFAESEIVYVELCPSLTRDGVAVTVGTATPLLIRRGGRRRYSQASGWAARSRAQGHRWLSSLEIRAAPSCRCRRHCTADA
jgi:hypothetical protein